MLFDGLVSDDILRQSKTVEGVVAVAGNSRCEADLTASMTPRCSRWHPSPDAAVKAARPLRLLRPDRTQLADMAEDDPMCLRRESAQLRVAAGLRLGRKRGAILGMDVFHVAEIQAVKRHA